MVLIDKQSRVPAYEQIRNQLLTLILVGTFAPHSQLPSIRSIAADAGVNINTVKKAFSDLESYGAIYTVPGKGSFVSEKAFKNDSVHDTAVSEASDTAVSCTESFLKAFSLTKLPFPGTVYIAP